MKTKAVYFVGEKKIEIREIEIPLIGNDEVLIRTEYSAISIGTERLCLLGQATTIDGVPISFPFIPGYQMSGIVEKTGSDVRNLKRGDRVFSFQGKPDGGHLQYHVCLQDLLLKIPSDVTSREASYLSLAQVGYDGAMRPVINDGDTVLITGDGILGQTAAQIFRYRGVRVILSGHHKNRLELARENSADIIINSIEDDLSDFVRDNYAGGVDVVVEATGKIDLVEDLLKTVKYDGQLVLLGYYTSPECFLNINSLRKKETTTYCPRGILLDRLARTLDLIKNKVVHIEKLITHEFHYTEARKAYDMIIENKEPFLGIALRWDQS